MTWEIVIGLETHAQLSTTAKIFSGASTAFGAAPNTQASAVDIALPGVLPVLNRGAVERAIRFGLAVGGTINRRSVFARKNYFYPDLPKGYQISQYEIPVVQGGAITIASPTRGEIRVALTRAHLEEDAGKSLHEGIGSLAAPGRGMTGIDLNRAGTPLLEIVSEPDLRSTAEAVAYAKTLHALVRWLGICDGNMQEGSFRCDANVSVRRQGDTQLGTRCEIKNLNSFRFLQQAIDFEIHRQIELIDDGGAVVQETRLYDPEGGQTRSLRSKEDAQDYRYFPDPDLPPLAIDEAWIARVKTEMPELPAQMIDRFVADYGFERDQAVQLVIDRQRAEHLSQFLECLTKLVGVNGQLGEDSIRAANWAMIEIGTYLNVRGMDIEKLPISPANLAKLVARILDHTISHRIAKVVFADMWVSASGGDPDAIIAARGLRQISDADTLAAMVAEVLESNPGIVAEYRSGKAKAFQSLVGKAMAATRGKANPVQVTAILRKMLGG